MRLNSLLFSILIVSGCAPVWMSIYDEDRLEKNLAIPMTKEQVREAVGKPDDVLVDDGHTLVWEYRLYRREAAVGNLPLVLAWGFGLIVPGEDRKVKKWVVLNDDQLCMWGNPSVVTTRKTCMGSGQIQRVQVGQGSAYASTTGDIVIGQEAKKIEQFIKFHPLLVAMPPLIKTDVRRVAIIHPTQSQWMGLPQSVQDEVKLIVEQILFSLRPRLPHLEIVERKDLSVLTQELRLQSSGLVRDEDMSRIGRMLGADHLLVYSLITTTDEELNRMKSKGGLIQALASWKLLQVESGAVVYQDTVVQAVSLNELSYESTILSAARQAAYQLALAGLQASLFHALIPDELGVMRDPSFNGPGPKILLVLLNSPAAKMGINIGDVIVSVNGLPVRSPEDVDKTPFSAMKSITVRRGIKELEFPATPANK